MTSPFRAYPCHRLLFCRWAGSVSCTEIAGSPVSFLVPLSSALRTLASHRHPSQVMGQPGHELGRKACFTNYQDTQCASLQILCVPRFACLPQEYDEHLSGQHGCHVLASFKWPRLGSYPHVLALEPFLPTAHRTQHYQPLTHSSRFLDKCLDNLVWREGPIMLRDCRLGT